MKYIALVRGINVGGNNRVEMPRLKLAFENNGFFNISTYINSGNVIFESDEIDKMMLSRICEGFILKDFNVVTRVAVISADELNDALNNAPEWWGADPASKHNAIFVIEPASADSVMKSAGVIKPEYEKIASRGNVIFWSAPIATFGRSRWAKVVGTAAYQYITIRNYNTAKKLRDLVNT